MNSHSSSQRAENEARTRDPDLGKVVLYQLSYFRRYCPLTFRYSFSLECGCKGTLFFLISKLFNDIF